MIHNTEIFVKTRFTYSANDVEYVSALLKSTVPESEGLIVSEDDSKILLVASEKLGKAHNYQIAAGDWPLHKRIVMGLLSIFSGGGDYVYYKSTDGAVLAVNINRDTVAILDRDYAKLTAVKKEKPTTKLNPLVVRVPADRGFADVIDQVMNVRTARW